MYSLSELFLFFFFSLCCQLHSLFGASHIFCHLQTYRRKQEHNSDEIFWTCMAPEVHIASSTRRSILYYVIVLLHTKTQLVVAPARSTRVMTECSPTLLEWLSFWSSRIVKIPVDLYIDAAIKPAVSSANATVDKEKLKTDHQEWKAITIKHEKAHTLPCVPWCHSSPSSWLGCLVHRACRDHPQCVPPTLTNHPHNCTGQETKAALKVHAMVDLLLLLIILPPHFLAKRISYMAQREGEECS